MALCQVAFMDQHISGRAALQSWRPDYAFTLVRANNTPGAWSLVEFVASAIVCIYRCILTPTCFFLSIAMQVFSVFVEILPVREQEPTRERDKMFANGTVMFANGQRSRMGRNTYYKLNRRLRRRPGSYRGSNLDLLSIIFFGTNSKCHRKSRVLLNNYKEGLPFYAQFQMPLKNPSALH